MGKNSYSNGTTDCFVLIFECSTNILGQPNCGHRVRLTFSYISFWVNLFKSFL